MLTANNIGFILKFYQFAKIVFFDHFFKQNWRIGRKILVSFFSKDLKINFLTKKSRQKHQRITFRRSGPPSIVKAIACYL
jgi:hypothetical protein